MGRQPLSLIETVLARERFRDFAMACVPCFQRLSYPFVLDFIVLLSSYRDSDEPRFFSLRI